MEFSEKKLPRELINKLYRVRVSTIKPYSLMVAPAYLYLRANEKFVAVKSPLDFFTEEDLNKISNFKYLYFSEFVNVVLPFREAGEKVRSILTWDYKRPAGTFQDPYPEAELSPTPYELSNMILRTIGSLWWAYPEGIGLDPFCVTVFANGLCDLFSPDKLLSAREKNLENYDLALFRSSWAVFLSLHLGYYDLDFLNELRVRVFDDSLTGSIEVLSGETPGLNEMNDLVALVYASLKSRDLKVIKENFFSECPEKLAQKFAARMERVKKEWMSKGPKPPSIYGKRGFIHG